MQREMIYVWTLLRAHTKGLKIRSGSVKDVVGHLVLPFIVLEE